MLEAFHRPAPRGVLRPRRLAPYALLLAAMALAVAVASPAARAGERLRLQGSTTFHNMLIARHQGKIEQHAGIALDVIANKSVWGLMALLEGRADAAMISADLAGEISALSRQGKNYPVDRLRAFEIVRSRVSFVVHPDNPVRKVKLADIGRIMRGELANWKELGGPDLAIKLVVVREGGGTLVAVRGMTIGDAPITAPGFARLESARHVVAVAAQEPGAIGIAQLNLVRTAGMPEVETDVAVEQRLSIVTLGDPSDAVIRLIDAARVVAVEQLM